MSILDVKDFSFTYPNGKKVIQSLSFSLCKGEMMLLCGKNGCGKSTLLRSIKKEVAPRGIKSGEITVHGNCQILFQDCEQNIIFRSAYEDLIFPACNSGMPEEEITRKAKEVLELFGISHLASRATGTLSGGEKQILSLASLFMLAPDLLLLDEPLSQLDEEAKAVFLQKLMLVKNSGTAIMIVEHHTDALLEKSEKVLIFSDTAHTVYTKENLHESEQFPNFPEYIRLQQRLHLPINTFTCEEAVQNLTAVKENLKIRPLSRQSGTKESVITCRDIRFAYAKEEILNNLCLELHQGESAFLCGKNGAGKSTLLSLICGFLKPAQGEIIKSDGAKIGYLAQNPVYSFLKDTLIEDYRFALKKNRLEESLIESTLAQYPMFEDMRALLGQNPLDLSGGERAKAAIFKLILLGARTMILDEPEKHLDKASIRELSRIINALSARAYAFLIVSHSPDFIYTTASTVHHLEGGKIQTYTPQAYFPARCETSLYRAIKPANIPLMELHEAEVSENG